MSQPYIKSNTKNAVATIEFFHPAHNSLPGEILAKLAAAISHAGDDDEARVIILSSGGDKTFCAGASFDELKNIKNAADGEQFFSGFADVINAMRCSPKFIIGRVQGKAVGGGVGLAAAVDYCLATKHAAIKLSELQLGLGPFVVGAAVQRKIGVSAFSQLTMDADKFYDAEWAREKGLYAKVLNSSEDLDNEVKNLATKLATYNPEATRELKQIFWQNTDHWNNLLKTRAKISGQISAKRFQPNKVAQKNS